MKEDETEESGEKEPSEADGTGATAAPWMERSDGHGTAEAQRDGRGWAPAEETRRGGWVGASTDRAGRMTDCDGKDAKVEEDGQDGPEAPVEAEAVPSGPVLLGDRPVTLPRAQTHPARPFGDVLPRIRRS